MLFAGAHAENATADGFFFLFLRGDKPQKQRRADARIINVKIYEKSPPTTINCRTISANRVKSHVEIHLSASIIRHFVVVKTFRHSSPDFELRSSGWTTPTSAGSFSAMSDHISPGCPRGFFFEAAYPISFCSSFLLYFFFHIPNSLSDCDPHIFRQFVFT